MAALGILCRQELAGGRGCLQDAASRSRRLNATRFGLDALLLINQLLKSGLFHPIDKVRAIKTG
jgi:hypothetical protein